MAVDDIFAVRALGLRVRNVTRSQWHILFAFELLDCGLSEMSLALALAVAEMLYDANEGPEQTARAFIRFSD